MLSNNNYHLLSNVSTWYCIEHEIYFTLFNSHRTKWGYFSFPFTCKETEAHGVKLAKTKESDPSLPDYDVITSFKCEPLGVLFSIEKYKRNQYFLSSAINLFVLTYVETVVGKEKLQGQQHQDGQAQGCFSAFSLP